MFKSGFRMSIGAASMAGAAAFIMYSCVPGFFGSSQLYDDKALLVQSLDLFNQRSSANPGLSLAGNWVFRRERLAAIDFELGRIRPDLVFMVEAMSRKDSFAESDREILRSGALASYQWAAVESGEYYDTSEVESISSAAGVPIRLEASKKLPKLSLGDGAVVAGTIALSSLQKIGLIQIHLPRQHSGANLAQPITEFIRVFSSEEGICSRRIVISGIIPGEQKRGLSSELMSNLGFKDVSEGRCSDANVCFTDTTSNAFNKAAFGEHLSTRTNKILVHSATYILSSGRNFDSLDVLPEHLRPTIDGQAFLPLANFGWAATVRLSRCGENESF